MKKKKKKKRGMFRFIVVLLLIVVFVLLFQTRSIKVKGNEYYGENSIISWLEKDKLSMNTVYLFWKYNYTDAEVPSVVEEMKLTFENPWTLVAHVKEKGKSGWQKREIPVFTPENPVMFLSMIQIYILTGRGQHFLKARKLLQEYLMWKDFLSMHRK